MAVSKKSSTKPQIDYPQILREEARKDIIDAARWYAIRLEGFDKRFIQYPEDVIRTIPYNPKTFKKIYKDFTQAALKKYPYVMVYEFEKEKLFIYSGFNAKQHPQKK